MLSKLIVCILIISLLIISGCIESNSGNFVVKNVTVKEFPGMGKITSGIFMNNYDSSKNICLVVFWYDKFNVRQSARDNCLGYITSHEVVPFQITNFYPFVYPEPDTTEWVYKIYVYENNTPERLIQLIP